MKPFTFFLLLITCSASLAYNKSCKAKQLEGDWYGDFISKHGNTYCMILTIEKVDKCSFTGKLKWPDYYNSISEVTGRIDNDSIYFNESNTIQGFHSSPRPIFSASLTDKKLIGISNDLGEETGEFTLSKSLLLTANRLMEYQEFIKDNEAKYGITKILNSVNIDTSYIINAQKELDSASYKLGAIRGSGTANYSGLEFAFNMTLKYPYYMLLEIDFNGQKFISASNKKEEWSYDPSTDKVTLSVPEDTSTSKMSTFFTKSLKSKYQITSIREAIVGGVEAYRFTFEKGYDTRIVYLSKDTNIILREEADGSIKQYMNPFEFHGAIWMEKFIQIDGSSITTMNYDTLYLVEDPPISYFAIPSELQLKVDHSSKYETNYFEDAEKAHDNGEYDQAIKLYTKAIDINPNQFDYYYGRALSKKAKEDYYGALSDFELSLIRSPNDPIVINYKGACKYALGDYKNALLDFERAYELDSTYAMAYYNHAFALFKKGNIRDAKEDMDYAINIDSTNTDFYFNRGIMLNELNAYDSAISDYKKSLDLGKDNTDDVFNRIGVSYFRSSRFDSAIVFFDSAIKVNQEPIYIKNLAQSYYNNSQYKEAIEQFTLVIKNDESDNSSINYLGLCYYREGDFDGAIFYFDKAISINNRISTYYQNRGFARSNLGQYSNAIEDFSQAIKLDPSTALNYYQIGAINELQHNKFDACLNYKKASELGYKLSDEEMELCKLTAE